MSAILFLVQAALVVVGAVMLAAAGRRWRAIPANMRFHVVFRRVMAGVIPLGAGLGWMLGWPALIAAALIVGFGEVFETSLDISALDLGNHNKTPFDPR